MIHNLQANNRWLSCVNNSGESIPAFGVCVPNGIIVASAGRIILRLVKPTADTINGPLYFNDGRIVPSGEVMRATSDFPAWGYMVDPVNGSVGDQLRAVAGQWYLEHGAGPFRIESVTSGDDGLIVYASRVDGAVAGFWAKITARSGTAYSWTEMVTSGSGCGFSVLSSGRSGSFNAFEINCSSANFDVPANLIVRMWEISPSLYMFDRGLTNESDGLRTDLDEAGEEWAVNNQPAGEAGAKLLDLLATNGHKVQIKWDSHGQNVYSRRDAPSPDPDCPCEGPFSGTKEVVTEVSVTSATLSGDCTTITIELEVTKEEWCFANGLLLCVDAVDNSEE